MPPALLLVIGAYSQTDQASFDRGFTHIKLGSVSELLSLSQEQRLAIRALAYKGHAPFGADEMALLPNLGLIANYGVGYDSIDVAAARSRAIEVTNTPDVLNDDVADLAVALALALSRRLVEGSNWVRSGRWTKEGELPLNRRFSGSKVGVLGLGRIGREIAHRLSGFKTEVHYFSRQPKETPQSWRYHASPQELASAVDHLFVAVVGGSQTQHIVDGEVLRALGPDGTLTNISRGSTVDEAALLDALEQKTIRGAALDVYAQEPELDPRYLALDNVVLQPHQGSGTVETRAAMAALQRQNIMAYFAGEALITPI